MSQKTPMQLVKEEHGGKEKLVDSILGNLEADGEEDKADLKRRLLSASNKKLLRLARSAQVLKEKYGSKEKLISQVASALGRAKDSDFVKRLDGYTQGRLLDMARGLLKGQTAEGAPAKAAPKPRAQAKPKAAAKPAARKAAPKAGAKARSAKGAKAGAKKSTAKKGKK